MRVSFTVRAGEGLPPPRRPGAPCPLQGCGRWHSFNTVFRSCRPPFACGVACGTRVAPGGAAAQPAARRDRTRRTAAGPTAAARAEPGPRTTAYMPPCAGQEPVAPGWLRGGRLPPRLFLVILRL